MMALSIVLALFASTTPAAALTQANAETMSPVATCVADHLPNDTRKLFATLPGSREEVKAARRLASMFASCGSRIDPEGSTFPSTRAALAVAAVADSANAPASVSATPWYASALAGRTAGTDYSAAAISRQRFGTCVAAAAPDAAMRLVKAADGSADERSAVAGLKPVLGGCVVEGETLKLTPSNLRLMLAEPLYHAISG